MVIDASVFVAILLNEPEADRFQRALVASRRPVVGAPTLVEATAVLLARVPDSMPILDELLARLGVSVVPMTPAAAQLARLAYARYGKGVGAPGVLNFGDCLAYGVAAALGEPLLFKGDDFSQTDIAAARY